jgi:antitoxin (DNA-binding transcriptional repressor) of toxin-antitoxin stability system
MNRELRNDFAKLSGWLADGEVVEITKRGRAFARLLPAPIKKIKKFRLPDFKARRRKIFEGHTLPGSIVTDEREGYQW